MTGDAPVAGPRRILVTGAGSGIGRACVARLRRDGADVLGVDRAGAVELTIDVTAPGASETMVAAAENSLGGLDGVVACAGVSLEEKLETHTDAWWDTTMAVNVTAVFRLMRAAIPALRASGRGRIVTIGSVMSSFAAPGLAAYSASKHAVLGLTRAAASELGRDGITVNCVQPGTIVTPMTADYLARDDLDAFWTRKAALGRLGAPEDIAGVVAFLFSDEAGFLSGQGILVDGGAMQQP
jgi:NAD(P)-dependent dehydrogenase (short-subunit alcohol dehydrogenase family)